MEKRIIIAVAGSDNKEFKNIAVAPTTRAIDVITALELTGFQLARPEGGMFAHGDNLYDAVADGQKVYAVRADVEAGV